MNDVTESVVLHFRLELSIPQSSHVSFDNSMVSVLTNIFSYSIAITTLHIRFWSNTFALLCT